MAADLAPAAAAATRCLGLGPGDDVLVICNPPHRALADALTAAPAPPARAVELLEYPTQTRHTAHLAFGTNATFGGVQHAAVHIDGAVLRPTIELDGRRILREGRLA